MAKLEHHAVFTAKNMLQMSMFQSVKRNALNATYSHVLPKKGSKDTRWCAKHAPNGCVNVRDKLCIYPDCTVQPSYGKPGSKAEYCNTHKLPGYVNVKNATRCQGCDKHAFFGITGTKKALFCASCKPTDYVNVVDKKCPDCPEDHKLIPCFGVRGTKIGLYCNEHKLPEYVNVRHRICLKPGCPTRATYNFIGHTPDWCSNHSSSGMICYPIKRCLCKKIAKKTLEGAFYCDDDAPEDAYDIKNICSVCCYKATERDQQICSACELSCKDGKTIKRKLKELMVKTFLEENKISVQLYDKIIPEGCSKRRPDFILDRGLCTIVLEVDEFQHDRKSYSCECEIARMKQIYFDLGLEYGKVFFIRYNPDPYTPSYGGQFNSKQRLEYLLKYINTFKAEDMQTGLKVLYLFYDGFSQLTEDSDYIDPYGQSAVSIPEPIVLKPKILVKCILKDKSIKVI